MKLKALIFLFFLFPKTFAITVINLGEDCQVTYYLRKYKLRQTAFPFDWLQSYNFNGVIKLLENEFKDFLNKNYLHNMGNLITNKLYNISFVHDFPTIQQPSVAVDNENNGIISSNYLDHLESVNAKYALRIDRLIKILNSEEPVYLIRTNASKEDAIACLNLLKSKYTNNNLILVVINQKTPNIKKWNIPGIWDMYAQERIPSLNNWWTDQEWIKIFKNLNITIVDAQ